MVWIGGGFSMIIWPGTKQVLTFCNFSKCQKIRNWALTCPNIRGLKHCVSKEDIFYSVCCFLHSKENRETFANDFKENFASIDRGRRRVRFCGIQQSRSPFLRFAPELRKSSRSRGCCRFPSWRFRRERSLQGGKRWDSYTRTLSKILLCAPFQSSIRLSREATVARSASDQNSGLSPQRFAVISRARWLWWSPSTSIWRSK